ncbi:HEPN domain-containing protein [Candidatus Bathyarchaeota archaeon]|nr:HEPN domain-containing protein [Candidatus Bathyarchaeota archaeon]
MGLYKLMKDFCADAYNELLAMKELPRPPYDSPLIARNPYFTNWGSKLYKLKSHANLQKYMQTSGLQKKLHDIGHTWFWHEEVFEWLFLERVIAESSGITLDGKVFDRVFKRAQAELDRPFFRMRRITVLVGVPDFRHPIELSKGVLLSPIDFSTHHYQLANLLGWRYQDKHRAPAFWIDPDSRLLIQTRVVKKGDDGKDLSDAREQMQYEAKQVVDAIKLSLDTAIFEKQVFSSYLSAFPLLPIDHEETEESKRFSVSVRRLIKKKEISNIRSCYKFIGPSSSGGTQEPQFLLSSLNRFAGSFRFSQLEQSVVDLIVSLEALFPVGEELRYRLATCVASVLGTTDNERKNLYRQVSAGYKLRNSIVHGGRKNQTESMANALKDFFPELKGKPVNDVNKQIGKAVWQLQKIVRSALRAYIHMRTNNPKAEWLDTDELEYLLFDSQKCTEVQKRLGLSRK